MRDAYSSYQVNLVEETAGFGAELYGDAMGVLECQVELVFWHSSASPSSVLELRCLGKKNHSFG